MNSLSNNRLGKLSFITIIFLSLVFPLLFHDNLAKLNGFNSYSRNGLAIHTIFELSSVLVSVFIAILGWMTFNFIKSKKRLLYSTLFLAIGLLDFLHSFYIEGMPFLFVEASIAKTGWFWMVARLTESLGILSIILMADRIFSKKCRLLCFMGSLIYVTAIAIIYP